jgi:hypothetical protein
MTGFDYATEQMDNSVEQGSIVMVARRNEGKPFSPQAMGVS